MFGVAGALWTGLAWFLAGSLLPLALRLLYGLGLGFATYQGVSLVMGQVEGFLLANWSGLPVVLFQVLSTLKVDVAMTIILSAYSWALTVGMARAVLVRRGA